MATGFCYPAEGGARARRVAAALLSFHSSLPSPFRAPVCSRRKVRRRGHASSALPVTQAPWAFCAGKGSSSELLLGSLGPVFPEAALRSAPLPAMGLLELCEEVFGTADLYRVLGVRREASDGEVRRGYHKVSLQVHPDRVGEGEKEDATRRFQILGKVYSVLSDKEQRAVYDEQGTVDEDSDALTQDRDWETYWRLLFKKISLEDIQAFEKAYKGSEEELADIKQAYLDFKGDMDQIMESVLCVQYTEEPRIRNIIQQAIDAREVPSYNTFVKESKQKMSARKRRAQEEAKEAEKSRKELGLEGVDNLKAVIQSKQKDRQKEMDSFLAQMEAKYCKPSNRGGKKTALKKEKK